MYYKILKISLFKKLKIKLFVKKRQKAKYIYIYIFFKANPKHTHNYKQNMLVPGMSMKFSK